MLPSLRILADLNSSPSGISSHLPSTSVSTAAVSARRVRGLSARRIVDLCFKIATRWLKLGKRACENVFAVETVKLAGLSASGIPAIIASKSLGEGVDGRFGTSFLSRFTVVIGDREIQLKAKMLEQ